MPQFIQELNQDALGIRTSARYDASAATWLADVANYIKSGAGLWVPLGDENPMPVKSLPVVATLQNAAAADGNGQTLDVAFLATVVLDIRGTFTATINFEGTVDDANWTAIMGSKLADGEIATIATASGLHRFDVSGLKSIRARVSGWSAGSVTVTARGTPLDGAPRSVLAKLTGSLPTGANEIGKVAPADSGKAQQLITERMDFAGKTAGQTHDNPHVAKRAPDATFLAPSSAAWTEFDASRYRSADTLDGTATSFSNSANGQYSQHLFSFDLLNDLKNRGRIPKGWGVAELKAALKSLTATWYGYGAGSNGGVSANSASVKIYRVSTNEWSSANTNTASAPSAVVHAQTSLAANYIDANGVFHVLAHSTYPSDGTIASTIFTDYVKLDVTLLTDVLDTADNLSFDRATQMQKVLSTPANVSAPLVVAPTMDFKGKTSAQTHDVPHIAKSKTVSAIDAPSTFSTEFSTIAYQYASQLDGQSTSIGPTAAGAYAQHLFAFDVLNALKLQGVIPQKWTATELKAAMRSVAAVWYGYGGGSNGGAGTNGATLKVWNASTSSWATVTSNTGSAPSALAYAHAAATVGNLIDANGFLHFLAHSTYAADGIIASTLYTDYVKLDVQLTGEYMMTDLGRAWDQEKRALRVTPAGRKIAVETIANAVSVAAGEYSAKFPLGITDEDEIWLAVAIDQQPWVLQTDTIFYTSGGVSSSLYPNGDPLAETAAITSPKVFFFAGYSAAASTLDEAKQKRIYLPASSINIGARVKNNAASVATVTIKVIRIWR